MTSPSSTSADAGAGGDGPAIVCAVATTASEVEAHHRIREAVFVAEQGFFAGSDRDDRDDDPATLKVVVAVGGVPGGAVRLYPLEEPGLWKGDRLAVLAEFRPRNLGAHLVRYAVQTAGERGGERMMAHVQPANVAFFRRLGWDAVGAPEEYVGRTHQRMEIALRVR